MHVLHITNHILERFHTCQIHKSPVFVPLLAAWIWPTKPRSSAGAPHLQAHPSRRSKSIPAKRSYPLLNMAVRCHSKSLSLSKSRWTIFKDGPFMSDKGGLGTAWVVIIPNISTINSDFQHCSHDQLSIGEWISKASKKSVRGLPTTGLWTDTLFGGWSPNYFQMCIFKKRESQNITKSHGYHCFQCSKDARN
jgi:hypothetical protein